MLKLYVDTMIRLKGSTHSIKDRMKNEEGFVSAETIGLAVAGVLIVGVMLAAFQQFLPTAVQDLFSKLTEWNSNTDTGAGA